MFRSKYQLGGERHLANVLFLVCQLQIVSQKRSRAYSKPPNDLVHIWAKRSSSGGNKFMDFRRNKFNFLEQLQLKILFKQDILSKHLVQVLYKSTTASLNNTNANERRGKLLMEKL